MKKQVILFWAVVGLAACNKEEPVPAYIHIPSVAFTVSDPQAGTASQRITNAWVYVNDQLIGAFPTPCTVPVLAEGKAKIDIRGGISENGISSTPAQYPFFTNYINDNVVLEAGKIDTIRPTMTYTTDSDFSFNENFENTNLFTDDLDGNLDTKLEQISGAGFEGNGYGKITLNDNSTTVAAGSAIRYILPAGQSPIYVEMNYKSTNTFTVGIIGYKNGEILTEYKAKLVVLPKSEWNKIYISLTGEAGTLLADEYQIVIGAIRDAGLTNSEVLIDNVKLVHF